LDTVSPWTSVAGSVLAHHVVRDDQVDSLIYKIADKLRASDIVGKIFVLDVPIALDIRTNKTGESAL
jgi:nitrogen regulatory protein P-II 1